MNTQFSFLFHPFLSRIFYDDHTRPTQGHTNIKKFHFVVKWEAHEMSIGEILLLCVTVFIAQECSGQLSRTM